MPRNITITFDDGTSHVYQNAPDDVTPDMVQQRAETEFKKGVKGIDGGSKVSHETPVETSPQAQPPASGVDQLLTGSGLKGLNGLAEGAANIVTGMGAQAAGGLRGLASLATGSSMDQAAQNVQDTAERYTYSPRTDEGRLVSRAAGLPIELGSDAAGWVGGQAGQAINGEQGRIAGESIGRAAVPIAATIAGGVGALKGAGMAGETVAARNAARIEELKLLQQKNAVLDETRNRVRAAGFINPAEGGVKSTIAGMGKVNPRISKVNEEVATQLVAREIGLPRNTPLSTEALAARQEALNKPYEDLINAGFERVGGLKTPPEMKTSLGEMVDTIKEKVAYDPETFGSLKSAIPLLENQLNRELHNPQMVMEQIKQLRKDAKSNSKTGDDPNKLVLAETQKGLADMLEGVFEYNFQDRPNLLMRFREARKNKAQIYAVADAFNDATGRIDIQKLSAMSDKLPLTGSLKTVSDFGKAYPQASARVRGATPALSVIDGLFAAGALAGKHPGLAIGELATRGAIPALAGRGMLSTKTPTYQLGNGASTLETLLNTPANQVLKGRLSSPDRAALGYFDEP